MGYARAGSSPAFGTTRFIRVSWIPANPFLLLGSSCEKGWRLPGSITPRCDHHRGEERKSKDPGPPYEVFGKWGRAENAESRADVRISALYTLRADIYPFCPRDLAQFVGRDFDT